MKRAWSALWAVALVAAAQAGETRPAVGDAEAARTFDKLLGTDWSGVYLLGQKIGWMKHAFSKAADGSSYEVATTLYARFKTLGVEQVMEIEETRTYSGPGWRLTRAEMKQTVGGRTTRTRAEVKDGGFAFTYLMAGASRTSSLPLPEESLTDALSAETMALDPATKPGTSFPCRQFDTTTGQEYHCVATLRSREEKPLEGVMTAVVVVDVLIKEMGITSSATLTGGGRVLETLVAGMFKVRLESEAVAKQVDVALDPLALSAIRINHELPDVSRMSELVLRISGLDDERFVIRSERQVYDRTDSPGVYRLTLKRDRWRADEIKPGPYDPGTFKDSLTATPFVQSDDPRIKELAKQIVGDETDPLRRVSKLVTWVHRNLRKQYTAALSSALDVLETRAGDCTEHSILFVALCRASGIPAEQITGVVYGQGFGGFVYHAWARVYVGKWIEVDPTFDETVVHPGHVAFAVGPIERQAAVMSLVGRVKMRYISHAQEQ